MSKNGSLIASEILIVDDEEDIRDLIAGILRDEGYETRVAGDSDGALPRCARAGRSWWCSTSGCRAAGSTASRCSITLKREHPDLPVVMISRPRHHRNRGRLDQEGRLRLHRKAVQGRPPDACGGARAGSRAAEARGAGTEAQGRRRWRADRPVLGHRAVAPA